MFGHDFSAPNTYAEDEIPDDDEIAAQIEAQEQQWAPKIKQKD